MMQQAVLHHFPDAQSTYQFTNRDASIYSTCQCYEQFAVTHFPHLLLFLSADITYWTPGFSVLFLTPEECTWLQATCPYFKPSYLDYLTAYRFKPSQVQPAVQASFVPRTPDSDEGCIKIEVSGPWAEAIFWEVPLLVRMRRAPSCSRRAAHSVNSACVAGIPTILRTL